MLSVIVLVAMALTSDGSQVQLVQGFDTIQECEAAKKNVIINATNYVVKGNLKAGFVVKCLTVTAD